MYRGKIGGSYGCQGAMELRIWNLKDLRVATVECEKAVVGKPWSSLESVNYLR